MAGQPDIAAGRLPPGAYGENFEDIKPPLTAGQAAIKLLEALGCNIKVAEYSCCGRPGAGHRAAG